MQPRSQEANITDAKTAVESLANLIDSYQVVNSSISPKNVIVINPAEMKNEDEARLLAKFLSQHQEMILVKGVEVHSTIGADTQSFQLSYPLIRYKCQSEANYHYYVINSNEVLGRGAFGILYGVLGKIKLTAIFAHFSKDKTLKALKVQKHNVLQPITNVIGHPVEAAIKEYELTPNFMQMKRPIIDGNTSYSLMMRIMGQDLLGYLTGPNIITPGALIVITLNILHALKELVYDQGRVHRDIKLANMMICNGEIIFIDWGLAKNISDPAKDTMICGTPFYLDPQIFKTQITDQSTDFYSTCRSLYVLWATVSQNLKEPLLVDLTKKLFINLCSADPTVRPTYADTLDTFEQVRLMSSKKALPHLADQLTQTYQLAVKLKAKLDLNSAKKLGCNDETNYLNNMRSAFVETLSQLEDHPILIENFVNFLHLGSLKETRTRQQLIEKIVQIIDTYQSNVNALYALSMLYPYSKVVADKRKNYNLCLENLVFLNAKFTKFACKLQKKHLTSSSTSTFATTSGQADNTSTTTVPSSSSSPSSNNTSNQSRLFAAAIATSSANTGNEPPLKKRKSGFNR